MKKNRKYLIGLVLLAISSFLLIKIDQSYRARKKIQEKIQTLQHCSFESLEGKEIYADEFDPKKPTVIIYFNPGCEHCQYEASEIGLHPEQFEKANMILITTDDSIKRVEDFAEQYHLWRVDNLVVLIDKDQRFRSYFGIAIFPSVFIYGPDRKLRKMYAGETKPEAIINQIN